MPPDMFDVTTYSYDIIHTRMQQQAFLNAGLKISTFDKREGHDESDSMCYEGGIREYVSWLNQNKTTIHDDVVYMAVLAGDLVVALDDIVLLAIVVQDRGQGAAEALLVTPASRPSFLSGARC